MKLLIIFLSITPVILSYRHKPRPYVEVECETEGEVTDYSCHSNKTETTCTLSDFNLPKITLPEFLPFGLPRYEQPDLRITNDDAYNFTRLVMKHCSFVHFPFDLHMSRMPYVEHITVESCDTDQIQRQYNFFIVIPSRLKSLTYRNTKLAELKYRSFGYISSLQSLNLNGNQIQKIHNLVFSSVLNLRELDLGNNRLEDIHEDIFKSLSKLQYLDLSYNRFKTMYPHIISSNENLLRFNLNGNNIEALDLRVPPKLKKLEISNNNLESVTLTGKGTLKSLQASGNSIHDLKLDIDIEDLDLEYNQMENLKPLLHLNLRSLDLSDNPLRDLTGIEKLVKLKTLWLDRINIKFSSQMFAPLTNLKTLSLSESQTSTFDIEPLKNLTKLMTLELSNDEIKTLDYEELAKLPSLKRLGVNYHNFNCSYFMKMSDYLKNHSIVIVDGVYSNEGIESYHSHCIEKGTSTIILGIFSFFVIFGIVCGLIVILVVLMKKLDWIFNTSYPVYRNSQ